MHVQAKSKRAILIAACGFARVGKDELGDILVKDFGYKKIGWADKLYEFALKLNPWFCTPFPMSLSFLVKRVGWTRAKRWKAVRKYLQWVGTELVRDTLGRDTWINTQLPVIKECLKKGQDVYVTNCRFENECKAILDLGGTIVKVTRKGVGPVNNHSSDAGEAFGFAAYEVKNDTTLRALADAAHELHYTLESELVDDSMHSFNMAIKSGLANGVRMILDTTAPHSVDASEWRKRHRLEGEMEKDQITVLVDGQEAGTVFYNDGVIEVNAKIAL